LRVHVLWSDGTPAPGVGVRLYAAESRRPGRGLAFLRSDEQGIALFANLPGENLRVRADRGAEAGPIAVAEIAPNGVRDVELRCKAARSIGGRVVGPMERPCPERRSTSSPASELDGMDCVARSGADGEFDLRDISPRRSIGATARGFGPSPLVDLEILPGKPPFRADLVLTREGGDLVGRVVDPAGAPVPHAWVCVPADARFRSNVRHDGTFQEQPGARATSCDEDGAFRLDGLAPRTTSVHVFAGAFALWSSIVKIEAGATTELRVELDPGAQLSGVVRDVRGQPVAGATVRAFSSAVAPTFVPLGQYDDPDPFGSPVARTDAEGRYRLGPVWSGEVHAYASPPRDENRREQPEIHAEEVFHPKCGVSLSWNPVLSPGHAIAGRVTFADGTPMKEVFVNAAPRDESSRRVTRTDERGAFAFYNLDVEPFRVDVQLWASPPGSRRWPATTCGRTRARSSSWRATSTRARAPLRA
jgi:protocatechuate 3,4-dioxygenase beta subunit